MNINLCYSLPIAIILILLLSFANINQSQIIDDDILYDGDDDITFSFQDDDFNVLPSLDSDFSFNYTDLLRYDDDLPTYSYTPLTTFDTSFLDNAIDDEETVIESSAILLHMPVLLLFITFLVIKVLVF
eukprot:TRINITY_DN5408_c0_g1_i1.p1 TRINITY_DN5408_c0_g1~~TRINITY_DN5408_c0_g1_i1.p1  ORF type:complete len:144 (+),score=36.77 TRINITY_DN5408_c0_g1_i1:47-433(+)